MNAMNLDQDTEMPAPGNKQEVITCYHATKGGAHILN